MPAAKLMKHPQAHLDIQIRNVWVADCAECGRTEYLRHAVVGDDDKLRCVDCDPRPWEERREWTPPEPEQPEPIERHCAHCGGALNPSARRDARYCGTRCRVAAHRGGA